MSCSLDINGEIVHWVSANLGATTAAASLLLPEKNYMRLLSLLNISTEHPFRHVEVQEPD